MTQITADVDFVEMAGDIKLIKKLLLGNGCTGLCERMDNAEKAISSIEVTGSKKAGYINAFWLVIGGAITLIFNWLKG